MNIFINKYIGGATLDSIEVAVQKVKNGEPEPFGVIIDEFQQKLFHYCCHMLGSVHDAEEAVQEVFFKAYKNIGSYKKTVSFSAWLYKIAYNQCINIIRRKKLVQFIPFIDGIGYYESKGEKGVDDNLLGDELWNALKKLSPVERNIIILRTVKELSYEEISTIINIKASTIRKKYERAKKKLQESIKLTQGGIFNERISKC